MHIFRNFCAHEMMAASRILSKYTAKTRSCLNPFSPVRHEKALPADGREGFKSGIRTRGVRRDAQGAA